MSALAIKWSSSELRCQVAASAAAPECWCGSGGTILSAAQIKRLRTRNTASQAVFAAYLNTSPSTVQKWEQGQKKPNGPSLKILSLVEQKGLDAFR